MRKISKMLMLFVLICMTSGCCVSIGPLVMGKDCNKKMQCNTATVQMDYSFNLPTSLTTSYEKAVKSVVTIIAQYNSSSSTSASSGSGIVFMEDETDVYILTNKHVVATKTSNYTVFYNKIDVVFSNYKRVEAQLLSVSTYIDLAVLKVKKVNAESSYSLPVIKNSFTDISIGDSIFAVGSPLGIDHAFSASFGSISNLYNNEVNFDSSNLGSYYPIQIDAAINFGNSGGGLFNSNGELVGMIQGGRTSGSEENNTYITTGINYALPITTVINVATNLINKGSYDVPNFGVNDEYIMDLRTMKKDERSTWGIDSSDLKGVLIRHTNMSQPAANAGISAYFVITEVDGIEVASKGLWKMYIASKNKGNVIEIKGHYVNNISNEITYQVTLD